MRNKFILGILPLLFLAADGVGGGGHSHSPKPPKPPKPPASPNAQPPVVLPAAQGGSVEQPAEGASTEPLPPIPTPEPPKEPEQTPEQKAASEEALKIAEEARTPYEKRMDANSEAAPLAPAPVVPPAPEVKTYGPGRVTCHSRSFHGQQAISQPINLPEAQTEDQVFYAFQAHHPSAMRQDFRIDPENRSNPDLRTDKE